MHTMETINEWLDVSGYSSTTLSSYRGTLERITREIGPLDHLSATQLNNWIKQHNWASTTEWNAFCAIRAYLRWAFGEGHPALRLKIKRKKPPVQRTVTLPQATRLLSIFNRGTIKGRRDLVIAMLALDTGLRSAELCRVEVRYLDLHERTAFVTVKGGEIGEAVYSEETAKAIQRWLVDRESIAAKNVRTLFISISGKTKGYPLTTGGLRAEMRKWARQAGLPAGLSPHDFRRGFATISTQRGAPSRIVQVAGRWKNIAMVEHYTRIISPGDMDPWFPVKAVVEHL